MVLTNNASKNIYEGFFWHHPKFVANIFYKLNSLSKILSEPAFKISIKYFWTTLIKIFWIPSVFLFQFMEKIL